MKKTFTSSFSFSSKVNQVNRSLSGELILDVVIQEVFGTGLLDVKIPVELNDACKNKLVGMGVKLSNSSLIALPFLKRILQLLTKTKGHKEYKKFLLDHRNLATLLIMFPILQQTKMGPKEVASPSVEVVNFDPLPPRR